MFCCQSYYLISGGATQPIVPIPQVRACFIFRASVLFDLTTDRVLYTYQVLARIEGVGYSLLSYSDIIYDACTVAQQVMYMFRGSTYFEPVSNAFDMTLVKERLSNPTPTSSTTPEASRSQWPIYAFAAFTLLRLGQRYISSAREPSLITSLFLPSDERKPPTAPRREAAKPGALPLPNDYRICPICLGLRRLPCASSAGYVYCYHCLLGTIAGTHIIMFD